MDNPKRTPDLSPELCPLEPPAADALSGKTRMAYTADLLLELRDMASAEGHATLAGLLALAHAEALTKSR